MAQTDTVAEGQPMPKEQSQKDIATDNGMDGDSENDTRIKSRTVIVNDDGSNVIVVDENDEEEEDESDVDISERLGEFSQANNKSNGFAAMSGANGGERQMFVHSYSMSTSSWRSWASRVAATTNINIVLRNISLLHGFCSLLLIFMGILGVVTKSYMSYLAIPIWSPIFFFLPTSFTGLLTYQQLRNPSLIKKLIVLSSLSTLLSVVFCVVFAFFIFKDGQLESDCRPLPSVFSSDCRISVYRVLIDAVLVFLYIIELIASSSSLIVCVIVKPGCAKKSSDTEQLISRTSMSYKRLAAAEETVEEIADPLTDNNTSNNMFLRSVSAPAIVSLSTSKPYFD